MQLKGLVRFFTILLIIYSLYQLSFTLFVRNHESKLEKRAKADIARNYPKASEKYPDNKDSQAVYQEQLDKLFSERLTRLKDSTKGEILTYGITGGISYQKAKAEELNLGLDLQGGMNITMEVEMNGLLKGLANNPKDPEFLQALENANKRRGNSDANFVKLFAEEFKKIAPTKNLASLFASATTGLVGVNDSDGSVITKLEGQAREAFASSLNILTTRIDQFGVAQPNISPDPNKGIITVELPGIQDKDRVRKLLQSSANLQFWETYKIEELVTSLQQADAIFDGLLKGTNKNDTTTAKTVDTLSTPTIAKVDTAKKDTTNTGITLGDLDGNDTAGKGGQAGVANAKRSLFEFLVPMQQPGNAIIGFTKDTAQLRSYLENPAIRKFFPRDLRFAFGLAEGKAKSEFPLYGLKTYGSEKAPVEGNVIRKAEQTYDQTGGSKPIVAIEMTDQGAKDWGRLTAKTSRKSGNPTPIAIVIDNIVYSAPTAEAELGANSQISGSFTVDEAKDLANILALGKVNAPAKIVSEQTVGPTLGQEAIKGGLMSFGISFLVIFILMLVYYNTSGWIANIALVLNLLFTVGVLAGLGATLTAAGIAGLVLTIGMAVDTNVIIYERIKEELNRGKSYAQAVKDGYHRSLAPVLDGHITSLMTAVILFYFGLGPVKGFATTQILGLLLSLFCGILVSRWITEIFAKRKVNVKYFTSISSKIFKHASYKFIEFRKVAYGISFVILALGIASFFNGFHYGVEFDGGRSYKVDFDKKVSVEQVREDLRATFENENPLIKTIGDESTLEITTSYLINETRNEYADSVVVHKLHEGLAKYLPANTNFERFETANLLGSKKVLPTISDDLKRGAVQATIFAIILIFLYIFIRFRDWKFSLGTIVSLVHDVLVTLIVFSFAKNIVPFPLEIDQHFIAAILTVIGFSMNDTVIVFDRIREDTKLYPNLGQKDLINKAINDTLSRTIMTSLTVFLTVLILFIFGGEVTRGFAFAMLIGVVTGIYSSIFVAAPILVDLGRGKVAGRKETTKS
jgi:SecD/SecF fusion protein